MLAILGSVALAYYLAWRGVRKISLAEVLKDDTMMLYNRKSGDGERIFECAPTIIFTFPTHHASAFLVEVFSVPVASSPASA